MNSTRLLILLAVGWALIALVQFGASEPPKRAPLKYRNETGGAPPTPVIRLALLTTERPPAGVMKDPFATVKPAPPPRPKPPPPPPPEPLPVIVVPPPPEPPPPPPGPTPEELAESELKQYRFLGFVIRGGQRQALVAYHAERFMVEPGQTLRGTIYLKELQEDGAVLADRPTNVELRLP